MSKEEFPTNEKEVESFKVLDHEPIKRRPWWKLGGKDESFVSVDAGYGRTVSPASSSETKLGTVEELGHNVWETEDAKEIYKPIEGYEGAHRFDPSLVWTAEEEKRLVRIVSLVKSPALHIREANTRHSSTGVSRSQPASCSLLFNLTEETSRKPSVTLCWVRHFPTLQLMDSNRIQLT
jgi:hypothetical protein